MHTYKAAAAALWWAQRIPMFFFSFHLFWIGEFFCFIIIRMVYDFQCKMSCPVWMQLLPFDIYEWPSFIRWIITFILDFTNFFFFLVLLFVLCCAFHSDFHSWLSFDFYMLSQILDDTSGNLAFIPFGIISGIGRTVMIVVNSSVIFFFENSI